MELSNVIQRNVEVIEATATVRDAARRMKEKDIGSLPVSAKDRIVGMLTDRDIVVRSIGRGDDPEKALVQEAMTDQIEFCYETDRLEEVSRKMSERQIRRMIVLDRNNKLVGIVSLGDLVRAQGAAPEVTHALEEISQPTKPTAAGTDQRQQRGR